MSSGGRHPGWPRSLCSSPCVKIYLCSNPEDSVVERRALRETVFPGIREHCRQALGLDVRVIDPFESSDPSCWPDEITRQQLMRECRESSSALFCLALIGHQYGPASLASQVEVTEFQLLLQANQQAGVSTLELERGYRRDENAIPPSYCLKSSLRHPCYALVDVEKERQINCQREELRDMFQNAVSVSVHRGLMTSQRAKLHYRSVLDADLRFALNDSPTESLAGRCLVYINKVINAKGERPKLQRQSNAEHKAGPSDQASLTSSTDDGLLVELCDTFLPSLVTTRHLLVYTTTTECDRRHGYTTNRRRVYAETLCQQVCHDLLESTEGLSISEPKGDALSQEQEEQDKLCNVLSRLYEVILPEEEQVRTYMEKREQQLPLVVTGGPCTGKTVLLAHCSQQITTWLSESDPVVISSFCNLSHYDSSEHLLSSLCCRIAERYLDDNVHRDRHQCTDNRDSNSTISQTGHRFNSNPDLIHKTIPQCKTLDDSLSELKEHLSSLMNLLPSVHQPLVLLLDGLDQVENNFGLQIVGNLPSPLPPNVKLVYSVSPNRAQFLHAIKLHYQQRHGPLNCVTASPGKGLGYVHVQLGPVERKQCVKMLVSLLKTSGRKVTSGQLALVTQALDHCSLPLYARLLHAHTLHWQSDSDVIESSLPDCIHSSISTLFAHLELKHGSSVVVHAVSYLALSRAGLTEAELTDLLCVNIKSTSDDPGPCDKSDKSVNTQILQVHVDRLLLDLKDFLIKRTVGRVQVLLWINRHFRLVVLKKYLNSQKLRERIHTQMADYLKGCLFYERFKTSSTSEEDTPKKLSSLPHVSQSLAGQKEREVTELTFHLKQSGSEMWDRFKCEMFFSSSFHLVMVQAGLLGDLVALLESDVSSEDPFLKERLLLAGSLRSAEGFLSGFPLELLTVMESKLLPFLRVFPGLQDYIKDSRLERLKRGNSIGLLVCPSLSCVPPLQRLKGSDKTNVRETTATEFGAVATVLNDGSAWIWNGHKAKVAKLSLSCEQKELIFKGVKSSGTLLLLSTQCNKLFVCDVTDPLMILEIKDSLTSGDQANHCSDIVEGFVAHSDKFFMSWKNESFVSVFDVSSEILTCYPCQSPVTCLVVSSDGFFLYCAMEHTVAVFHIITSTPLGTCSDPTSSAITSMVLCEDTGIMATVDRKGNVGLWDVTDKIRPPRIVKKVFSEVESNSVLSTDYSEENSSLVVVQPDCITLWDTYKWELWDQLLAPQGSTFTQAVVSHDRQLFLALVETCSLVLVWRLRTGECILSLETNYAPCALLKSSTDIICVSHDGSLAVWDAAMIAAAATAFKMQCAVKCVLVDEGGKWFYTGDGSESVWRWCLDSGLPYAYFLHDGPVEKLKLSPNGLHLVSISAGDIYMWRPETGENVMRISGSRAIDVLFTSSSNIAVSLSDRGLSHVWKVAQGKIVCSIHLCLTDAQVSLQGTFLFGLRCGDLLAASLWSGSISKSFSCVESSEHITAFHLLSQHPDFVLVMAASGAVYTWNVAEETGCKHFQLPPTFYCEPQHFHMSSDGSYALLSTEDNTINLLDLSQMRLCSFTTDGPVFKACLDKDGDFIVHISHHSSKENPCFWAQPSSSVLTATRLSDGETIGRVHLSKNPQTLVVCRQKCVFVGFQDGSVGVYSVSNGMKSDNDDLQSGKTLRDFDREPFKYFPLPFANVSWA